MKNLLLKSASQDGKVPLPAYAFAILSAEMQGCPRFPAQVPTDPAHPLQTVVLCHRLPDGHSHFDWLIEQPPTPTPQNTPSTPGILNTPCESDLNKNPDARVLLAFRMEDQLDLLCLHALASHQSTTTGCKLPDHRRLYLEYQGPISGDRGTVHRLSRGTVRWIVCTPDRMELVVRFDSISCQIQGQRLSQPKTADTQPKPTAPAILWKFAILAL